MDERILDYIGKVTLDLTHYPGEDKYCDGDIEDTLLEIAKDRSSVEFPGIIEESKSWPILYHLSPLRENIVEWLPIDKNMKVLEVGAGCGAITGALSRKAGSVTCCDLSLKRSKINAYRHMDCENVTIHVGNFCDVEADLDTDYDFICLIGVFEYAQAYMNTDDPYGDFLKLLKKHCKSDGNIAIAIENKFGLKYWAGCKEDHLSSYFSSIEDYPQGGVVRTFTDRGLKSIVDRCGFATYRMYYPYPDYKFMINLYSDERLPNKGECKNNIRNMDQDRIRLFNEKDAFDSIIDEGLFSLYSNSYMMIIGPKPKVDYVRYSNDRMDCYSICTELLTENGQKVIKKRALSEEAVTHLKNYERSFRLLKSRYKGSRLNINECTISEDGTELTLEYVKGITLEQMLDECLAKNDTEGFVALFKEYLDRISYGEETALISDLDMIFSNIIVDGDEWTVIDYEWTLPGSKPVSEIGFRAIYCYVLEDEKRDKLSLDLITEILGVDYKVSQELRDEEMKFQKDVTGNHKTLDEIRELIGNKIYTLEDILAPRESLVTCSQAQLYEDDGRGFREDVSTLFDTCVFEADIPIGRKSLRIDPCMESCIVAVNTLQLNGRNLPTDIMHFKHNGKKLGDNLFAFTTSDPGFTISLKGITMDRSNRLTVDMTVIPIDKNISDRMR